MTTATATRGGAWLIEPTATRCGLHARAHDRRPPAHRADDRGVRDGGGDAGGRAARAEGLGRSPARCCADAASWACWASTCPRRTAASSSTRCRRWSSSEHIARSASFGATYGAQANLCILPILMFGTDDQKQRYLPEAGLGRDGRRLRAQRVRVGFGRAGRAGARRLVSPTAASPCRARRCGSPTAASPTSCIVFAKVDGEHFSAFIVERAFGGVTSGKEEHKMGLHGSSTTPVILQDVPVPAANLLGEIGKGHKVAFNVLNFGRLKLGAMCTGGCKTAIGESAKYAASRRQFGQPIASFGAIRHKLGEMTARTYALESADVSHGRADRPAHGGLRRRAPSGAAGRARGVCRRGVDRQGRRQRGPGLRARRERADSRRQRLRPRLSCRAPLPRRPREPHLRGHQRDQPAADSRAC